VLFRSLLSAFLFGALAQGGTELSMEIPSLNREMVVIVEGLIIIFCGALENMFRKPVTDLIQKKRQRA
jgi:simple sugar transport system permease protein